MNENISDLVEKFYLPFGGKLNSENRWIQLAKLIPWDKAEQKYVEAFKSPIVGKQAYSVRVALGSKSLLEVNEWIIMEAKEAEKALEAESIQDDDDPDDPDDGQITNVSPQSSTSLFERIEATKSERQDHTQSDTKAVVLCLPKSENHRSAERSYSAYDVEPSEISPITRDQRAISATTYDVREQESHHRRSHCEH